MTIRKKPTGISIPANRMRDKESKLTILSMPMVAKASAKSIRSCIYIILFAMLAAIHGCGQGDNEGQTSAPGKSPNIDQLRSLPYVGGSSIEPDDSTGVILYDEQRTCPGYRLYTVAMLGRAELIDEQGSVLRSWQYGPNDRWIRAELLPNGDLLVIGAEDHGWKNEATIMSSIADSSRYVIRLDWSSKLIWKRKLLAHHDIELTPNGKLLLLTFNRKMDPSIHPTIAIRDDYLTLLEQDATMVESKSILEAIRRAPKIFPLQPVRPVESDSAPWMDLFHSNSIEWMHHDHLFSRHIIYGPDNILVCFRHQDRIAIFNWPENRVIWSWGLDQISGPHDAQVLENGHVLLFDNGISRGWSRAIELDPFTGKIVWQYHGRPPRSFFTLGRGSAQRLPNGNTLLAESDRGRAIEVTPEGDIVWEYLCPYRIDGDKRAAMVRMIWHSPELIDPLLSLSSALTIENSP